LNSGLPKSCVLRRWKILSGSRRSTGSQGRCFLLPRNQKKWPAHHPGLRPFLRTLLFRSTSS